MYGDILYKVEFDDEVIGFTRLPSSFLLHSHFFFLVEILVHKITKYY